MFLFKNVQDGLNITEVTKQILTKLKTNHFSINYTFCVGGEYETQQDLFGHMEKILIVALLGLFAVLVLQFKSYEQSFVIFSTIPYCTHLIAMFSKYPLTHT